MSFLLLASAALIGLVGFRRLVRWRNGSPPTVRPPTPLPTSLEAILPLPLPEGTFPVLIAVRFRGVLIGLDLAAASFVDGWLHVEGVRASFAVRAGEGKAEWRSGTTLRIEFLDGQSVSLWMTTRGNEHFRHAATLWISDQEHPAGDSILPPLEVQPALRLARRAALHLAIVVLGSILTVDTLLGHRLASSRTFCVWGLGLLIALRLAFVEGRLHEARALDADHA